MLYIIRIYSNFDDDDGETLLLNSCKFGYTLNRIHILFAFYHSTCIQYSRDYNEILRKVGSSSKYALSFS